MPRAGLTPAAIVELALSIVDSDGLGGLSLTAVAQRAGVAVPALYKHVRNLAELQQLVRLRIAEDFTQEVTAAVIGRSGEDALRALASAARHYATRHPNRYATTVVPAPEPDPRLAEAGERLLDVFLAVFRGFGLEGTQAIHATRAFRAAMHGFATIQGAGGFARQEDVDVSYDLLIRMLIGGLPLARELA